LETTTPPPTPRKYTVSVNHTDYEVALWKKKMKIDSHIKFFALKIPGLEQSTGHCYAQRPCL